MTKTVFSPFNPTACDLYFGISWFLCVLSVLFNDALDCHVYTTSAMEEKLWDSSGRTLTGRKAMYWQKSLS